MPTYIALVRKEEGTSFGVDFPDFPGCVSGGETLDQAVRSATEALAFHIEGMADHDEVIPEPSTLDQVMADPHNRDAVAVLVPTPTPKGKVMRVNITVEEQLLKAIDQAAETRGMTRSGFLAVAARHELNPEVGFNR